MRHRLRAVIFDWAGTIVDFGSCAPVEAFLTVFRRAGIEITTAEARAPMGSAKRDHIAAVLAMPEVVKRWKAAHGAPPTETDIDRLYADFVPTQSEVIPRFAELIPGAVDAANKIRARGMLIGSTTGYSRRMMETLVPLAAKQGFAADHVATGDGLPSGRPAPWMCFRNMEALGVYPPAACVKVGDTVLDVEEGLNAGMWTVAVAATGNEVGLSVAQYEALSDDERRSRVAAASEQLGSADAHYVVESVADVPGVLDRISERLEGGEKP